MDTFDHLLNWKLKAGSHRFPGPDGGTCVNEAALVAAGFDYRPINSAEQMPDCFSRPVCRFAMRLNDDADDEERQRLLPYVTRLACADSPEIEQRRAAYINWNARRCSVTLHGYGRAFVDFGKGLEVLEGALAIGRQADPFGPEEVQTRMDAARAGKIKTRSVVDRPVLAKVKSWLTAKEIEPAA